MKVLIDTNILLCAVFDEISQSRRLLTCSKGLSFYYSDLTYHECLTKIHEYAQGVKPLEKGLVNTLNRFISNIEFLIMLPSQLIASIASTDQDDAAIISTATHHGIETICTYNLSDFLESGLSLETPGTLNKRFAHETKVGKVSTDYFAIYPGTIKSILLSFKPYALDTIGKVFGTRDGRTYSIDELELKCNKRSTKIRNENKLNLDVERVNLWISPNNDGNVSLQQLIEVDQPKSNQFDARYKLLRIAVASVQGNALVPCFAIGSDEPRFYGRIHYILAYPIKLTRKSVEKVFNAGTVDVINGSVYWKTLLSMSSRKGGG